MLTFLIETLELPNFGHMTKSTIQLGKGDEIFIVNVMDKNYDVTTFILKHLYFKKVSSSQFCCHHQNCNYFC